MRNRARNERILKVFGVFLGVVFVSYFTFALLSEIGNSTAPGAALFYICLVISLQISFLIAVVITKK